MSKVAEEIINIKIDEHETFVKAYSKFYKIMRKYGIKRGTKSGNGTTCDNFEWTMCETLFHSRIKSKFELWHFLTCKLPKDLESY